MTASTQQRDDDPPERRKNRPEIILPIIAAIIAVIGTTAAALITRPPHSNPCANNITITSPSAGQSETGGKNEDILVKGTACNMADNTGWLVWRDTDGTYYLEYYNNPPQPTITGNGSWSWTVKDLGNPGDKDQQYEITVVLASPACTNDLEKARPDSEKNISFKVLPSGCQADNSVDVNFSYS
jgi:hypothetical protein